MVNGSVAKILKNQTSRLLQNALPTIKIIVKIDLAFKELWCPDKSTRMLRVTLFSGLTRQQKKNVFNVLMSLNVGDFMKLRKEAKCQREKLYFWIKHHIYTNVKQCLN